VITQIGFGWRSRFYGTHEASFGSGLFSNEIDREIDWGSQIESRRIHVATHPGQAHKRLTVEASFFRKSFCRQHDKLQEREGMRTITGQKVLCLPALLVLSFGSWTHLSIERLPAPRASFFMTRMHCGTEQTCGIVKTATVASWYGKKFQGRKTSSGERFDLHKLTAASRTLPLGSLVRITVVASGRSVVVRINDRGPWLKGRDLDLSEAAAIRLGIHEEGIAAVEATLVK
jgi:rare lipoprotein A (peptidoglycan hydrolase)